MSNTLTTKPLRRGNPKGLVGAVIGPLLAASSDVTRGQATTKDESLMSTLFQAARYIGAVCVMLILPLWMATAAAAHDCDPFTPLTQEDAMVNIQVPKFGMVNYTVTGFLTAIFDVAGRGDSSIATIEPLDPFEDTNGVYLIAGVAVGNTQINIIWTGTGEDSGSSGDCLLLVEVVDPSTLIPILNKLNLAIADEQAARGIAVAGADDVAIRAAILLVDSSILRLNELTFDVQSELLSFDPGSEITDDVTRVRNIFKSLVAALGADYKTKLFLLDTRLRVGSITTKGERTLKRLFKNALKLKEDARSDLQQAIEDEG